MCHRMGKNVEQLPSPEEHHDPIDGTTSVTVSTLRRVRRVRREQHEHLILLAKG